MFFIPLEYEQRQDEMVETDSYASMHVLQGLFSSSAFVYNLVHDFFASLHICIIYYK